MVSVVVEEGPQTSKVNAQVGVILQGDPPALVWIELEHHLGERLRRDRHSSHLEGLQCHKHQKTNLSQLVPLQSTATITVIRLESASQCAQILQEIRN